MGLVAKQSIWNTSLLYAGVVIGFFNVTFFFPLVIGSEGYGLTRLILSVVFIAQHFAMLGTPSILMKFFPKFQNEGRKGLIRFGFGVLIIGLLVVCTSLYFLKDLIIHFKQEDSPLFENYYLLCIPILIALSLYLYLANLCRVHLQSVLPVFTYEFLFKLLTTVLLGFAWFYGWSLNSFLLAWAGLYFVNVLILFIYLLFTRRFDFGWDGSIKKPFLRESMDFGLFTMMAGASNSIISNIDIVMLGLLLTQESLARTGFYAIMVYLGNAVLMPTRGLGTIASPLIAKFTEEGDRVKLKDMYVRTSLNQMVATGFLLIGIFINLRSLLIIIDIPYDIGMPVFVLIGLTRLVQSGTGVNGLLINYSPLYRYTTLFIVGLAIVAVVSNYILIPKYALTGAAMASLISITGFEALKWGFVWKRLGMQPFYYKHLLAIALGIALLAVNYLLPVWEPIILDILLRSSIVSLVALVTILKVDISPDLRNIIVKALAKVGLNL